MTWKITKTVKKIPKLKNPILIEGLPGIGNVGKVAVDFIIDELKAKKLYDIFSYTFPHSVFVNEKSLGDEYSPKQGTATANNKRFLRYWYEVSLEKIGFSVTSNEVVENNNYKWFLYNKGGGYRKWFGNNEWVINWEKEGKEIKEYKKSVIRNPSVYFKRNISWSKVSSNKISVRFFPEGYIFDSAAISIYPNDDMNLNILQGYLNSRVVFESLRFLAPTLNFTSNEMKIIPLKRISNERKIDKIVEKLIEISKQDWNSYEVSADFVKNPIMKLFCEKNSDLKELYFSLSEKWKKDISETQKLEEENNRIFISEYELEEEMVSGVLMKDISLNYNPNYRYPGTRSHPFNPEKTEKRLKEDTMKELISYAVGCMFGRYSLDKDGLIFANRGETLEDYLKQIKIIDDVCKAKEFLPWYWRQKKM
jgi:hypothetical protein